MLVSGLKTRKMDKEWRPLQMEILTKANSKMQSSMAKESILMPMVHPSKEFSKMAKSGKVTEQKSMIVETHIQGNSKMVILMDKESILM